MSIAYVVGARPNFVKMAPVIAELRARLPDRRHVLIHTGQHYDRAMSELFFEELNVPQPDHLLGVGSGSHATQTARVMERLEPVLREERPDLVIVPGDVNSTLAATLVAVKLGVPVAHVESGLRSFDLTDARGDQQDRGRQVLRVPIRPQRGGDREPSSRRESTTIASTSWETR